MDALKVAASQMIVLHHLAVYDPLGESVAGSFPGLILWLHLHGRWAVQVFLVIGGFLATRHLMPAGKGIQENPVHLVFKRYLRLIIPLSAALLLAMASAWVAREWMPGGNAPATPGLWQCLAHLLLMQDVLGIEALSAGVWYVAIDFQLFAALAALLGIGSAASRRNPRLAELPWLLAGALAAASLLVFNRHPELDMWAIYFFGSYGLGVMACRAREGGKSTAWLVVITVILAAALALDFRGRLIVAACTAWLLAAGPRLENVSSQRAVSLISSLGRSSYSLFLVHYPICLLANAAFTRTGVHGATAAAAWMVAAWAASMLAAACFYRWVEMPAMRLLAKPGVRA